VVYGADNIASGFVMTLNHAAVKPNAEGKELAVIGGVLSIFLD